MSYDLGLGKKEENYQKEYEERYKPLKEWLKDMGACECGDSVALLGFTKMESIGINECIRKELNNYGINEASGLRIYVIAYNVSISPNDRRDNINHIEFAGFIIGNRGKAAWEEEYEFKGKYQDIDINTI
jgi:hypothetical protein